MTPKQKAEALVKQFDGLDMLYADVTIFCHDSKKCAIIVCKEFISRALSSTRIQESEVNYWNKVKDEIENMK